MFTKTRTAVLALTAVATLGLASLATTTSADARGFGARRSPGPACASSPWRATRARSRRSRAR